MAERDYRAELGKLADQLRDPLRMRIAVSGLALAVAYFGIFGPLDGQIRIASRRAREAAKRVAVAQDVEFLRAAVATFEPRISPSADANESVQYVLNGIRKLPVKLINLSSNSSITVGPYEAAALQIEVGGEMRHLDALLEWLETNQRLLRIDSLQLEPPRLETDQPKLRLTLLALKVKS